MDTIKDAEKAVEKEFNKDVDLVKDATGMDTWWVHSTTAHGYISWIAWREALKATRQSVRHHMIADWLGKESDIKDDVILC